MFTKNDYDYYEAEQRLIESELDAEQLLLHEAQQQIASIIDLDRKRDERIIAHVDMRLGTVYEDVLNIKKEIVGIQTLIRDLTNLINRKLK